MKFPLLATSFAPPVQRLLVLALCCFCLTLFRAEVQAKTLAKHKCDTTDPQYANGGVHPDPCDNSSAGEDSTKVVSNGEPYYRCIKGNSDQQCCMVRATIGDYYRYYGIKGCPDTGSIRRSSWNTHPEVVWSCDWDITVNGKSCAGNDPE